MAWRLNSFTPIHTGCQMCEREDMEEDGGRARGCTITHSVLCNEQESGIMELPVPLLQLRAWDNRSQVYSLEAECVAL